MTVAKSIGLLYKINRFLPETILKMLYTLLILPHLSYGIEAWHGTYQNNTSKIFVFQKKVIRAINNLAYNEHTNAYFKCNKILELSDQYNLQVSNYIFQLLHSNIDEEIESSLLITLHVELLWFAMVEFLPCGLGIRIQSTFALVRVVRAD